MSYEDRAELLQKYNIISKYDAKKEEDKKKYYPLGNITSLQKTLSDKLNGLDTLNTNNEINKLS